MAMCDDLFRNQVTGGNADALLQMRALREEWHVMIAMTHVKGHQDDNTAFEDLSFDAQLNCRADQPAMLALDDQKECGPEAFIPLPAAQMCVVTPHGRLCSQCHTRLWELWAQPQIMKHCRQHFKWSRALEAAINWRARRSALGAPPSGQHKFVTKITNGILPSAKILNRCDEGVPDLCPICHQHDDNLNPLRCIAAKDWQSKFFSSLDK